MGVTIKDVAKEASVSASTVSRVIAGNGRISDKTKEKVREAIKKLNYHPNILARSLANKSTKVIGLVLPNQAEDLFKNPFFIHIMTGISSYAQKLGYYIMYTFFNTAQEELDSIENYINSNLADGIILTRVSHDDKAIKYLQQKEFPFVVIGRPEDTSNILWVDNDNFQAMYNVTSKLLLKGHKKIGFIGAKSDLNVSKDRLNGYRQAHIIHGVDINENSVVEVAEFKEELGYDAAKSVISQNDITALVCTDDLIAFGVSLYLNENDIKNISVVGFNNTPLAEYQTPSLTSVDINAKKLGYYAAKMLVDKLQNTVENKHCIIETNLVERDSTKL